MKLHHLLMLSHLAVGLVSGALAAGATAFGSVALGATLVACGGVFGLIFGFFLASKVNSGISSLQR
ncbi:MAG: hypothetical protein KDA92_22425, partial [Planctomycetales bacterium]|nr:hypothetical protein [Planctomycetales bacterium]